MNLLLLAPGSSVFTPQWCDYYFKNNIKVTLITFEKPLKSKLYKNIEIIYIPTGKGVINKLIGLIKVKIKLHKRTFDFYHAHQLLVYGSISSFLYQKPLIVECMGSDIGDHLHNKLNLFFAKKVFKFANFIAVKDIYAKKRLLNFLVPKEKIIVRPSFYDPDLFFLKKRYFNKKPLKILFTRRFDEKYKSLFLLDLFTKISAVGNLNVQFILLKRGQWQLIEKYIINNKLNINVKFLDPVMHENMNALYSKADVFLDTFYSENSVLGHGMGTGTIEAMASGLILLFPDRIEYKNTIFDNFIYKKGDAEDLFKKINLILSTHSEKLKNMSLINNNNSKQFSKKLVMDVILNKFIKLHKFKKD
jgi:glycosyltransferase involved in cell wall biosynthesis